MVLKLFDTLKFRIKCKMGCIYTKDGQIRNTLAGTLGRQKLQCDAQYHD